MTDETTGAVTDGGPAGQELTSVQRLVALDAYSKALSPHVAALREQVKQEMAAADDERKAAKLPDGTKIGAVSWREGAVTARVTDEAAALAWCIQKHPEHIMQAIRPAFLAKLLDEAKREGVGVDTSSGEILSWITVSQSDPGITVTSTAEGKAFAASLVGNFAGMIEAAK